MGGCRNRSGPIAFVAPNINADYNVTGDLTPDAKCNYDEAGVYDEHKFYARKDGAWFIWWDGMWWTITNEVGVSGGIEWRGVPFGDIVGDYEPLGGASGVATVAAGSH